MKRIKKLLITIFAIGLAMIYLAVLVPLAIWEWLNE